MCIQSDDRLSDISCSGWSGAETVRALIKYDVALKYAPNWKQLKEAREAAAKLKT